MKHELNVSGMHCPSCEMLITDALGEIPGIQSIQADAKAGREPIETDQRQCGGQPDDQHRHARGQAEQLEIQPADDGAEAQEDSRQIEQRKHPEVVLAFRVPPINRNRPRETGLAVRPPPR